MATVLVVVNELSLRDDYVKVLSRRGHKAIPVMGPTEAVKILQNHPPVDVVLSEIIMPEMRGTDFVREFELHSPEMFVREIELYSPETACILIAGGAVDLAGVPLGIPLLCKPISQRDLVSAVQAASMRCAKLRARSAVSHLDLRQRMKNAADELEEARCRYPAACKELLDAASGLLDPDRADAVKHAGDACHHPFDQYKQAKYRLEQYSTHVSYPEQQETPHTAPFTPPVGSTPPETSCSPGLRSRRRFCLLLRHSYKVSSHGGQVTGTGQIIDISSKGVRFTTEHPLMAGTRLILTVLWPARLRDTVPLKLLLDCVVLRASANEAAAQIRRFEFRTRSQGSPLPFRLLT